MPRRWDIDERGEGIGDAGTLVPGASELLEAMVEPAWVAEDPEAHLLPHLRRACDSPQLPLELTGEHSGKDGAYEVSLLWTGSAGDVRSARAAAYALIGEVAESATYVRQRRAGATDVDEARDESGADDELVFEVATGMLAGDTTYASHGHVLVLRLRGVFG